MAAKAGYDPLAMGDILDRLSKTVGLVTDQEEQKSYFDSHPYTPDLNFTLSFPSDWVYINQAFAVGAVHADKKAAIVVGLEDPSLSPEEHARIFEKELMEKHKKMKPSKK